MQSASVRPEKEIATLGRYRIREHIASGGMGAVYLAELVTEHGFCKPVALKLLRPELSKNPRERWRFLDEARLAAAISHPNVCSVFDFGEIEGTQYMAMEYLQGQTLRAVTQRAARGERVPLPMLLRIVADAAHGLHAVHEIHNEDGSHAGVVHRDVSPQNIFVQYSGASKILDFGVAHRDDAEREATDTEQFQGKLCYAAPEQLAQSIVDRRADVWALGVILWEAATQQRLIDKDNMAQTLLGILSDPIPAPSTRRRTVPPALDKIIMAALEREPEKRTATALELAHQLEEYLGRLPSVWGIEQVSACMNELFSDEDPTLRISRLLKIPASEAPSHVSIAPDAASVDLVNSELVARTSIVPRQSYVPAESGHFASSIGALVLDRLTPVPASSGNDGLARTLRSSKVSAKGRREAVKTGTAAALAAFCVGVLTVQVVSFHMPKPTGEVAKAAAPGVSLEISSVVQGARARTKLDVPAEASPTPISSPQGHEQNRVALTLPEKTIFGEPPLKRKAESPRSKLPAAGYLYLTAPRPMRVYADGRLIGSVPLRNAALPAGTYMLSLVPTDGGRAKAVPVTVASRSTVIVAMR